MKTANDSTIATYVCMCVKPVVRNFYWVFFCTKCEPFNKILNLVHNKTMDIINKIVVFWAFSTNSACTFKKIGAS